VKVLITGGLGYLGGRIAVALTEMNCTVRLGSRKPQSPPDWLPQAEITVMNMLESASLSAAMQDVQAVVHLAAVNEIESITNPEKALLVNTLGTMHLLETSIQASIERFIYFSTAHVYGAPLVGKITEMTVPRPVHPYAITHHAAENFVMAAHDSNKLIGIVTRLSNGIGFPMTPHVNRWTLIVNDLCRQAITTGKLILHSPGLQYRDFITLEDVCRAVAYFLMLPKSYCGNGLFNLGGECPLQIIELAKRVADRCLFVLGFKPVIERPETIIGDAQTTFDYRIDKLKDIGFKLCGSIDSEIDETLRLCQRAFI